jgi:hypothetical protein
MTQTAPKPITSLRYARRHATEGSRFLGMIRTTDPKDIAILYLVTSFAPGAAAPGRSPHSRTKGVRPGYAKWPARAQPGQPDRQVNRALKRKDEDRE